MISKRISTTIKEDLHDMAKKAGIVWAEALEIGVRNLLTHPAEPSENENFNKESIHNHYKRKLCTMQGCIDDLNRRLEESD